ncbi:MAG: tetratricopeptide repeat protein [Elusimicrobia bacterium]|nr:tetratricopeptide repeat protein [Elusimicrobiota bacterium]
MKIKLASSELRVAVGLLSHKIWRIAIRPLLPCYLLLTVFTGCGINYQFKSAEKLKEDGKFSEAIQKYEKIIEKNPESPRVPEAVFNIAKIYHQNIENFYEAKKNYRRIINDYSNSEWVEESKSAMLEIADYFPLQKFAKWIEVDSDTSGKYMTAKNEIIGVSGDIFEMTRNLYTRGNFISGFRKYYKKTNDGFYETDKDGKIISTVMLLPVDAGKEWSVGNVKYAIVSKNEEVTVTAGKFSNCVKIKKQIVGTSSWSYEYFAPEVGKILTTQSSGGAEKRITELKEYTTTDYTD